MFDRSTCRQIQGEIVELLKQRYPNLHVEAHGGKFATNGSNFTFPLELAVIGSDGQAETQEVREFKRNASLYGLKPEDLGKTFHSPGSGHRFKITGLKSRNRRYQIMADRVRDGKGFKFDAFTVKQALERES